MEVAQEGDHNAQPVLPQVMPLKAGLPVDQSLDCTYPTLHERHVKPGTAHQILACASWQVYQTVLHGLP